MLFTYNEAIEKCGSAYKMSQDINNKKIFKLEECI